MASTGTVKRTLLRAFVYAFLICFGGTMIIPFCWMLSTSVKRKHEVFQFPPKWIPTGYEANIEGQDVICTKIEILGDEILLEVVTNGELKGQRITRKLSESKKVFAPDWRNYPKVWQTVPFGRFYLNSVFIASCITFGQVLTSAMAAYAFARLRFPGRDYLFFGYLATLMIPSTVTMIPLFVLLSHMPEWLNFLFSPEHRWWSSDHHFPAEVGRGRRLRDPFPFRRG
ncbi:carbohydrate ABC transporter permease [Candidatus Hydrogenedentota bacterium]